MSELQHDLLTIGAALNRRYPVRLSLEVYVCQECQTFWRPDEISSEASEKDGCPDCLHECERCGELLDNHGTYEHCL